MIEKNTWCKGRQARGFRGKSFFRAFPFRLRAGEPFCHRELKRLAFFGQPRLVGFEADCSGIAIGGNVTGATIRTGAMTNSDCASKPK